MKKYDLFYILIFIIFFIILLSIINYQKENFELQSNGNLCGTLNDTCRIDQYGKNSCCDGYSCIRQNGNFYNRVCLKGNNLVDPENNTNSGFFGFIKSLFSSGKKKLDTFCEEEDLTSNLKDMCQNPYKLNFGNLGSICKIKMPTINLDKIKQDLSGVQKSQSYNQNNSCPI